MANGLTNEITRPLVIVPTYNERANIPQLVPEILGVDPRLHVLVVDDSSPDGTALVVQQIMSSMPDNRVFLETRPGKLGLAGAYIHGFNWALARGYDFLIEMDADWSHQPKYLKQMLAMAPEFGFVIGSRYVPRGGTLHWGLARKLLSRLGSRYARWVLGIEIADFTGGFNGWHAEVIQRVCIDNIRSDGYSFQIELKCRAAQSGFTHSEFPIVFDERRAGKSKMSAAIACEAVWRIWTFRAPVRASDTQTELRQRHP